MTRTVLMLLAILVYGIGYMHGLVKAERMADKRLRQLKGMVGRTLSAFLLVGTLSDSLPRRIQGVIAWAYGPSTHLYYVSAGTQVRLYRGLSMEALISPENKQAGHRVPLHGVPQVGFRFVF
jgi:prolipoprotein diacylglyceryltransferase